MPTTQALSQDVSFKIEFFQFPHHDKTNKMSTNCPFEATNGKLCLQRLLQHYQEVHKSAVPALELPN